MTALPKHWPSSRRQGKRRAADNKKLPPTTVCKNCQQPKLIGFECQNCQSEK